MKKSLVHCEDAFLRYYHQRSYTGKRVASMISNLLWRLVMTIVTLIIVAICAYGCYEYLQIMGTEI